MLAHSDNTQKKSKFSMKKSQSFFFGIFVILFYFFLIFYFVFFNGPAKATLEDSIRCKGDLVNKIWIPQSNPVESSRIQSNPVESSRIQFKNPVKSSQIQSNPVKSSQIQSNPVKSSQIQSNRVAPLTSIIWRSSETFGGATSSGHGML